jgi:hypothetical protein
MSKKWSIVLFSLAFFPHLSCFAQLLKNFVPYPHPRILWLNGDEQDLKLRIDADSSRRAVWRIIINECDDILTEGLVEEKLVGRRLLKNAREFRRRIFFLGFAWRLSGEQKYLDRAQAEMIQVASFSSWNPTHFLDVAEITMGMSVGYDWLFGELTPASRKIIETSIIEKGLKPGLEPENTSWLTVSHNWNQVCNAGLAFGAMAVYDLAPDLAAKIIERSYESIQFAMKEYEPDGGYVEGYGYWNYGTTFNVLFLSALDKFLRVDHNCSPAFLKTARYLVNMVGPSGQAFNYSDGDPKPLLNPAAFWFAERLNDPSLLFQEYKILRSSKHLHRVRELPLILLWGNNISWDQVSFPQSLTWCGSGKNPVALMRSSWRDDGIFVGLKAGSPSAPHGHMDVGSFVIDSDGERWAMDFQNQDYNSLETKGIKLFTMKQTSQRWSLLRASNKGHNTLTFDGEPQNVDGHSPIIHSTTRPEFVSAVADLSAVYQPRADKVLRGVAIVEQNKVIVRDEITAGSLNTTVRWNMLTAASVSIQNSNTAILTQNGKSLFLKVLEPATIQLRTWSTAPTNPYEDPNPGTTFVGFEIQLPKKRNVTLSVLLIPGSAKLERQEQVSFPPLATWAD